MSIRPEPRTTIKRWAIKWRHVYHKRFSSDVGYALFETRADALEYQERNLVKGDVIKVRITVEPDRA
jgi:hypothetical protein